APLAPPPLPPWGGKGSGTAPAAGAAASDSRAPASVATAARMRRMWFMVSSLGVDSGGGSGEELAQAQDGPAPCQCGRQVVGPRGLGPASLGGEPVLSSDAQHLVVAGLHQLVVDVHGPVLSAWSCCLGLGAI